MHVRFVWVGVRLGTSGATMRVRYMWVVVRLGISRGHYAREVQYVGCGLVGYIGGPLCT